MHTTNLIKIMKKPEFFGKNIKTVNIIETHISYIFLTGNFAFKLKKPVDYGFLNFSTLEKRKYYCNKELELNKRLCPDIYLEILPITQSNNKIELNGSGKTIEYVLKMKEFPQDQIMHKLLKNKKITKNNIKEINKILINFYNTSKTNTEIKKYGQIDYIKRNLDENFDQIKPFLETSLSTDKYKYIKKIVNSYLNKKESIFINRILTNHIHDCHGDLHTKNIVILKKYIYIFDCIEFNKRFRFCDSASDIGFLSMDLDYQNYPYLSSFLIKDYIEKSNDQEIIQLLNFYKSYRAFVRGKVTSFNLKNNNKIENKKNIESAKKYFDLSKYYTNLCNIELMRNKPLLIIICGLTGTGKSTLSMKISIDYNAKIINSDITRKKIAKLDIYSKHHNEINTGLYSSENTLNTYKKIIKIAKKILKNNENVIIDATFHKKEYRGLIYEAAKNIGIKPIFIQCTAPDKVIKNWLKKRLKTKTVSDGRWEIYVYQKNNFDNFEFKKDHLIIDMSKNSYENRNKIFNLILSKINEVIY